MRAHDVLPVIVVHVRVSLGGSGVFMAKRLAYTFQPCATSFAVSRPSFVSVPRGVPEARGGGVGLRRSNFADGNHWIRHDVSPLRSLILLSGMAPSIQ